MIAATDDFENLLREHVANPFFVLALAPAAPAAEIERQAQRLLAELAAELAGARRYRDAVRRARADARAGAVVGRRAARSGAAPAPRVVGARPDGAGVTTDSLRGDSAVARAAGRGAGDPGVGLQAIIRAARLDGGVGDDRCATSAAASACGRRDR